jgi:hypothetical protein
MSGSARAAPPLRVPSSGMGRGVRRRDLALVDRAVVLGADQGFVRVRPLGRDVEDRLEREPRSLECFAKSIIEARAIDGARAAEREPAGEYAARDAFARPNAASRARRRSRAGRDRTV